jgi:ferric-dicitrate binding protein FerR (iron transport regulator)
MTLQEARLFVASFIKGDYTPEGYATFLQWLEKASIDDLGIIADEHEALFDKWPIPAEGPSQEWIMQLEQKIDRIGYSIGEDKEGEMAPVRRIGRGRFVRRMVSVAAASVVIVAAGAYIWYTHSDQGGGVSKDQTKNQKESISKIFSVPRGGQQQQYVLPDGTKVWLNAASTLQYSTSFAGKDRIVELSGEAFFEVSKNAVLPFRVKVKGGEIDVLGTRFNVKAYEDEPVSRTTLVDGSVKIIRGTEEIALKPGEQAEMSFSPSDGAAVNVSRAEDMDAILSWKDGDLNFNNEDLRAVMRQIARCYDMSLKFDANVPDRKVTGSLSRKSTIEQNLSLLEHSEIHCKIMEGGKTIEVMH